MTHAPSVLEDQICVGCGCLCDDLRIHQDQASITMIEPQCAQANQFFLQTDRTIHGPDAAIDGQPTTLPQALSLAAELLRQARSPLIMGLTGLSVEAQRESVALADRSRAILDWGTNSDRRRVETIQRLGKTSANLTEVKNRADLVVFWEPSALPRHRERYSVEPSSRFLPGGASSRTVLVASANPVEYPANLSLTIRPNRSFETLNVIRALIRNRLLDETSVQNSTGIALKDLQTWNQTLLEAGYGAFFLGPTQDPATQEAAIALVRDLNHHTRFALLGMGGLAPGHHFGAESVLTWQTGSPLAVNFAAGQPRHEPLESNTQACLNRQEIDLVLALGPIAMDQQILIQQAKFPLISIAPKPLANAKIAIACTELGWDQTGTVQRVDGQFLMLKPLIKSQRVTDHQAIAQLRAAFSQEPKHS